MIARFPVRTVLAGRDPGDMAERAGVSLRTVQRWIARDAVDWATADVIACRILDTHPVVVWGPDWLPSDEPDTLLDELVD